MEYLPISTDSLVVDSRRFSLNMKYEQERAPAPQEILFSGHSWGIAR
jgi:hypothetical protein